MTVTAVTCHRNEQGHIVTPDGHLVALAHHTAKVVGWWLEASAHVAYRQQYAGALQLLARERALQDVACPAGGTHRLMYPTAFTPTTGTPRCVGCGATASDLLAQTETE